jgi:hypothetical protein
MSDISDENIPDDDWEEANADAPETEAETGNNSEEESFETEDEDEEVGTLLTERLRLFLVP